MVDTRDQVHRIVSATLRAVEPGAAVLTHLVRHESELNADGNRWNLLDMDQVVLVAIGKAAVPMAQAVCSVIDDKLARGVVVTKYNHTPPGTAFHPDWHISMLESAHPVPDENSLKAGERVQEVISACTERTLVVACISGGASALMIAPHTGIRLATLQAINDALLKSGADIREMNQVRSKLDQLKGGGLARLSAPGQVLGLILSDVIGDPLDVIASGLTNDPRAINVLVANNTQACQAAAAQAKALGYQTHIVTTELQGEAKDRGEEIARLICTQPSGSCLIYGGEPTVTIHGNGKGGRNQELTLAAAIELSRYPDSDVVVCSFGTDGTDGPTDAAGAIAFQDTVIRGRSLDLSARDVLEHNDSYRYFQALGDLVKTGPTGTNVADVVIALRP